MKFYNRHVCIIKMSDLKEFQKKLDTSFEDKEYYLNAEAESDEDEDTQIRISAPRKNKKPSIDTALMEQLILANQNVLKAQKKVYKLTSDLDIEEVKMRYLKLDLNNSDVKINELTNENKIVKQIYNKALIEIWFTRSILVLYFFLYIYAYFSRDVDLRV
jgi:hypothetical protein